MQKQYIFLLLMSFNPYILGMSYYISEIAFLTKTTALLGFFSNPEKVKASFAHTPSEQEKLKAVDNLLQSHVQKYYPGHKAITWKASDGWRCNREEVIQVPQSFINNPNEETLSSLDHELCHIKFKDSNHRSTIWMRLLYAFWPSSYQKKCMEQEQRADEASVNNLDLLKNRIEYYKDRAKIAENRPKDWKKVIHNPELIKFRQRHPDLPKSSDKYTAEDLVIHPSDAERAARFQERYDKLKKGTSLLMYQEETRKQHDLPPYISATSPQKAARILGLDIDYYPTLAEDMTSKVPFAQYSLKPSPLTNYYTRQRERFTTVKAIEYIP